MLVAGLLRTELRFEGLVVSDALEMRGISAGVGVESAAVLALEAGVDVLLIAQDRLPDGRSAAPTTFVIAHRFSTILSADTIVVMDRGRIFGQGKHEELLRTCETYQQLYERQLCAAPAA